MTARAEKLFETALLIEDEPHLASSLQIALKKLGIRATHAATAGQARKHILENAPELVVLDLTLPDGDGLEICRELRRDGFEGMILMLTARSQVEERVAGLKAGADDYLPKPFSWDELTLRIRALARRKPGRPAAEKSADDLWELDEKRLRILGPRGWVELTPLEFKLARHLMEASGAIVSRDELLKDVWGFHLLPKTRTVDHFLGRLRRHFEADPEEPRHFLTVRGAGYRFQK